MIEKPKSKEFKVCSKDSVKKPYKNITKKKRNKTKNNFLNFGAKRKTKLLSHFTASKIAASLKLKLNIEINRRFIEDQRRFSSFPPSLMLGD